MKCGIVRALWGDVLHRRLAYRLGPPEGYYSILCNVRDRSQTDDRTDRVYCWGKQNYDFCKYYKLPAVLVDPEPYALPKLRPEREPSPGGMMVWGMNIFWHRWEMLELALQDFDAVVALDWDVGQVAKIPYGFWEERRQVGVPIQATLIRIKNSKHAALWRRAPDWGSKYQDGDGLHIVAGCCIWCGDRNFVRLCKEENLRNPVWDDQQVISRVIDRQHGDRWIGTRAWAEQGYEPGYIERGKQVITPDKSKLIWVARRGA